MVSDLEAPGYAEVFTDLIPDLGATSGVAMAAAAPLESAAAVGVAARGSPP